MKRRKEKIAPAIITAGLFALAATGCIAPSQCQAFDASMNIAPNIINLESTDHTFGIHTDVPYSIVNIDEIILVCPEGAILFPSICYADSRGYLVAKFETADLGDSCELVSNEYNTLMLEGETRIEPIETFAAAGDVLVIEDQAQQRRGNGPMGAQNKTCPNR